MLNISIRTIPHSEHRYATVGDWQTPEEGFGQTAVVVSDLGNEDYEFAVAVHELIEMHLARKRGIQATDVTAFDEAYEAKRPEGDVSEPGDDPACPVYREHQFATKIEKLVIEELGIDWDLYEKRINDVCTTET